jgi:hypothetical protein
MMSTTEKRHSFRNSLFLTAHCRVPDQGMEMTVKLRNISPEGLMAEGPGAPLRRAGRTGPAQHRQGRGQRRLGAGQPLWHRLCP